MKVEYKNKMMTFETENEDEKVFCFLGTKFGDGENFATFVTEDELEKFNQADFLENAQDDIDDLMSGRIKDVEHLEAASTLLEKLMDLSSDIDHISELNQDRLYKFINSKSMEELKNIFDKLDDFGKWFNKEFDSKIT